MGGTPDAKYREIRPFMYPSPTWVKAKKKNTRPRDPTSLGEGGMEGKPRAGRELVFSLLETMYRKLLELAIGQVSRTRGPRQSEGRSAALVKKENWQYRLS